jgi:hypothetical protein
MTQQNLFPTEQDRRTAIFDYFLEHFDIVLCVSEEYDNLETNYPEEYAQYLEYEKKKH